MAAYHDVEGDVRVLYTVVGPHPEDVALLGLAVEGLGEPQLTRARVELKRARRSAKRERFPPLMNAPRTGPKASGSPSYRAR
jgi:hypothetical protein